MTGPGPISFPDYNAQLGVGSDIASQEWNTFNQRRGQLVDSILQRLQLQQHLTDTGVPKPKIAGTVDDLVNRSSMVPQIDGGNQEAVNQLYGAAQYYGITNYDKIPLEQLQKIVDARRMTVHEGDPAETTVENRAKAALAAYGLGTTQTLIGLAQRLPFIGDVIARRQVTQQISQHLAQLNEGTEANLSPDEVKRYETVKGVFGNIAYALPVSASWEAAGAIGALGPFGQIGARLSPIVRATVQGGASVLGLEGGDPNKQRLAEKVAFGAAFAGGVTALAQYTPALISIFKRVKTSFPAEDVTGATATPPASTVDAEWQYADETPRLTAGGAPTGVAGVTPPAPVLPAGPRLLTAGLPTGSDLESSALLRLTSEGTTGDIGPALDVARNQAVNLTKQTSIMESPILPDVAKQPTFDNLDVAKAAIASNPSGIQVIQGIGDQTSLVRKMVQEQVDGRLMPHEFRFIQRNLGGTPRTDLLITDGLPISNVRANQYQAHGLFNGQRVLYEGTEGTVKTPGQEFTTIETDGGEVSVPTHQVLPGKTTRPALPGEVGLSDASGMYSDFRGQVMAEIDAEGSRGGLRPLNWTDPEVADLLPRRMDSYFDTQGVTNPTQRAALNAYFNLQRVQDYQALAPDEVGQMRSINQTASDAIQVSTVGDIPYSGFHEKPATGVVLPKGEAGSIGTVDAVTRAKSIVGDAEFQRRAQAAIALRPADPLAHAAAVEETAREIVAQNPAAVRNNVLRFPTELSTPDIQGLMLAHSEPLGSGRMQAPGMTEQDVLDRMDQPAGDPAFNRAWENARQHALAAGANIDDPGAVMAYFDPAEMEAGALPTVAVEPQPSVYDLAPSKLFSWVNYPTVPGGTLLDLVSGEHFPMPHEGAAVEFLRNFNREVPDLTPASDVPAEVMEVVPGAQHPGVTTEGTMDTDQHVENLQRLLDNEDSLESDFHEAQLNRATGGVGSITHVVEAGSTGGGGSGRVPPPPPPGAGLAPEPSGRSSLGPAPSPLGFQFARVARESGPKLYELQQKLDSAFMRYGTPMRYLYLQLEPALKSIGIEDSNLYGHYHNISIGVVKAHNEAGPWHTEWTDIMTQFPRRWIRDGTVTRVAEIADYNQRLQEMQRLGYNDKQVSAQRRIEDFMDRFFGFLVGDPAFGNEARRRIFGYMSHVRMRQGMPGVTDPYADKEGFLSGPTTFFGEFAREGGLGQRQMNAEWLGNYMVRAAMFKKHVGASWDAMNTAWNDERIPTPFRNLVQSWLSTVKGVPQPGYSIAINGVRSVLNTVGIPATDGDVQMLWNVLAANMYRATQGLRADIIFRDSIQPLFTGTRIGFTPIAESYTKWLKDPAERAAMRQRGITGGWIERGAVRASVSEVFDTFTAPVQTTQGQPLLTPEMQNRRDMITRVFDTMHDMLPQRFKGGIQGTAFDPLLLYGIKLQEFNRTIAGDAGWRVASRAIQEFRASQVGGMSPALDAVNKLMKDSRARVYPQAIREKFLQLVNNGQDQDAINLMANEVANSQMRYGVRETAPGLRSQEGRLASMWGNFTVEYIQEMLQGLKNGTPGDRTAFAARQATVIGAISAAAAYTGWKGFSRWQWHNSLSYGGGPVATGSIAAAQAIAGGVAQMVGAPQTPDQADALRQELAPNNNPNSGMFNMVFPYAGGMRTASGVSDALEGANPTGDMLKFLLTGSRGAGVGKPVSDFMNSLPFAPGAQPSGGVPTLPLMRSSVSEPIPANSGAFNGSLPTDNGVTEINRVYSKNGHPVYDTQTPDASGHVPTHKLDIPSGRNPGETWESYEQRVLQRRDFGDTTANSNVGALEPTTRSRALQLLAEAARQHIDLRIGETLRSQDRQEYLFQQGRSRPGPVVTWTLTSDHTPGRALDLEGSDQAKAWLQTNASRFGFSTLGSMDPGHIFLPDRSTGSIGVSQQTREFLDSALRSPVGSRPGGGAQY